MTSETIFDMLGDIKKENSRMDALKEDVQDCVQKIEDVEGKLSQQTVKLQQTNDVVSGKVRQDELYELRMKVNRDMEVLKKMITDNDTSKKEIEKLDSKFVTNEKSEESINKLEKELSDIKLCLVTYVKNAPSTLSNKDYERRLSAIEQSRKLPIPVNRI